MRLPILLQQPVISPAVQRGIGFGRHTHPILKREHMHTGIDWIAPLGSPVVAAGDGVVAQAGRRGRLGNFVEIDHGHGVRTRYAHLARITKGLSVGTHVKRGAPIGTVGSTGLTMEPHLHFEVVIGGAPIDPDTYAEIQRGR